MAYRKKRRVTRPKRKSRRTPQRYNMRSIRLLQRYSSGKVYNFKQTVDGVNIPNIGTRTITQGSGLQHFGIYFTLADLPQASSFTTLFDQYKINKITIKFIPMTMVNGFERSDVASVTNPGMMGTVIDFDDANTLSNINAYEEYQNFRYQSAVSMKTHSRTFRPHIAMAAYQGTFAGFTNVPSKWIDCANATVQHYGVKFYMDVYASANTAQAYQVFATYYLSFKNVR